MAEHTETAFSPDEELKFINDLVGELKGRPGFILTALEKLQARTRGRYLSADTLRSFARQAGLPLSQVYSVTTFYSYFNLAPQPRNTLRICRGTACHSRGSHGLLQTAELSLRARASQDQADGVSPEHRISLRTVPCLGQCALAPVVAVNDSVHGHVTERHLRRLIEDLAPRTN